MKEEKIKNIVKEYYFPKYFFNDLKYFLCDLIFPKGYDLCSKNGFIQISRMIDLFDENFIFLYFV